MPLATTGRLELRALTPAQQAVLAAHGDQYEQLAARLHDAAGGSVLVIATNDDEHLDLVVAGGHTIAAAGAELRLGRTSGCHANTAWLARRGECRPATGYALSDDGYWRQHSWGVTSDGRILETTVARTAYFGVVLTGAAEAAFVIGETADRYDPYDREAKTVNLDDQRTTLSDTLAELLHAHQGDHGKLLVELGVALEAASEHYANERLDYDTTAEGDDDLFAMRAERGSYPRAVALSAAAHRVVCGMVQPTDVVDADTVTADDHIWVEVRRVFPAEGYSPAGEHAIDLQLPDAEDRDRVLEALCAAGLAAERHLEDPAIAVVFEHCPNREAARRRGIELVCELVDLTQITATLGDVTFVEGD
jgi:hypothetical protein